MEETTTIGSIRCYTTQKQKVNMISSIINQSNDTQTTINSSHEPPLLIPGLPNHLAQIILSTIRPSLLYAVCRQWRHLIYTPYFSPFLSLYAIVANNNNNNDINFFTFDPISSKWTLLPFPNFDPPIRFLHRHPSFLSRTFSIQSLTVDGCLVLIAATDHNFLPALAHPLVFNPLTRKWFLGPKMTNPRRWCATGCVDDTVYVASGVSAHYRGDVARMVEKWDMKRPRYCDKFANCTCYIEYIFCERQSYNLSHIYYIQSDILFI